MQAGGGTEAQDALHCEEGQSRMRQCSSPPCSHSADDQLQTFKLLKDRQPEINSLSSRNHSTTPHSMFAPGAHLLVLPDEIIEQILIFTDPVNIAHMSSTCKMLRNICRRGFVWRKLRELRSIAQDAWQDMSDMELCIAHYCARAFSWGEGRHGRLGNGSSASVTLPCSLDTFNNVPVIHGAAGSSHTVLLDLFGRVWSFGFGQYAQLGHGERKNEAFPRLLDTFKDTHVIAVACGENFSVAVDRSGCLYSWGTGNQGELGQGSNVTITFTPQRIDVGGSPVCSVACGCAHTLAVTQSGDLYSWGCGWEGKLGHGSAECSYEPQRLASLREEKIRAVCCGRDHSMAVTTCGKLFSWGSNTFGHLGLGDCDARLIPEQVSIPGAVKFAACGDSHSIAYCTDGMFAWGFNGDGAVGDESSRTGTPTPIGTLHKEAGEGAVKFRSLPRRVSHIDGTPSQVACGLFLSAAVAAPSPRHPSRSLWMWGKVHGQSPKLQLGQTDASARMLPSRSSRTMRQPEPRVQGNIPCLLSIVCGWEHTVACSGWLPDRMRPWLTLPGRFAPLPASLEEPEPYSPRPRK